MKPRVSEGNVKRLLMGELSGAKTPMTGRIKRRLEKKAAKKKGKG